MLKSLYSGVSGMKSFQTKMDVIANNIANTNTTAFKSGRTRFQDMISQTTSNASGPTRSGAGGINPQQVGLGVRVGAIDTMMEGGQLQPTNRGLDFAIENEGFFAVSSDINLETDSDDPPIVTAINVGTTHYTRDGAFFRDSTGSLVNSNGERVLGYVPELNDEGKYVYRTTNDTDLKLVTPIKIGDPRYDTDLDGNIDADGDEINTENELIPYNHGLLKPLSIPDKMLKTTSSDSPAKITAEAIDDTYEVPDNLPDEQEIIELQSYSVDTSGQIIGVYSDGNAYLLGQVGIVKFSNPEGMEKVGNNNYVFTNNSGAPVAGEAGGSGFGTIRQGFLEMSNVDLANEFTEMIIASRAYSANSRSITTSDEMLQELINLKR